MRKGRTERNKKREVQNLIESIILSNITAIFELQFQSRSVVTFCLHSKTKPKRLTMCGLISFSNHPHA